MAPCVFGAWDLSLTWCLFLGLCELSSGLRLPQPADDEQPPGGCPAVRHDGRPLKTSLPDARLGYRLTVALNQNCTAVFHCNLCL